MALSMGRVQYEQGSMDVLQEPFFVMLGWAVGLVFADVIYSHLKGRLRLRHFYQELCLFSLVFSALLVCVETIGYHACGIRNVLAGGYSGLPLFDCLHGPVWVKLGYFLTGPIYFALCRVWWQRTRARRGGEVCVKNSSQCMSAEDQASVREALQAPSAEVDRDGTPDEVARGES